MIFIDFVKKEFMEQVSLTFHQVIYAKTLNNSKFHGKTFSYFPTYQINQYELRAIRVSYTKENNREPIRTTSYSLLSVENHLWKPAIRSKRKNLRRRTSRRFRKLVPKRISRNSFNWRSKHRSIVCAVADGGAKIPPLERRLERASRVRRPIPGEFQPRVSLERRL